MQRIVVILGPTAAGKSDLAVALAEALDGEVLNADSMQVYRYLDAGTAKPTAAQRAAVPHHLLDCVEPTGTWTVADWLDRAERLIDRLHRRGRLPIVVGGTNLYLKALLEGLFPGPPADPAFRRSLQDIDTADLHARLQVVDPAAAERIAPADRKRIVRALEVHHATGRPISQWQQQWLDDRPDGQVAYRHHPILIGLAWSVPAINRRINSRVKAMFFPPPGREDLVSETARLEQAGLLGPQARQAIGTRQVLEYLAGRCSLEQAIEQVKIDTRRFAKQQRTWLKRYRGVHWLDAEHATPQQLAGQALAIVRRELERAGDEGAGRDRSAG